MRSHNRNPQVRGRVVHVVQEKGYCFVEPLEELPRGYALSSKGNIFRHRSANNNALPVIGATGTFTIEKGPRGIRAVSVEWDKPVQGAADNAGHFVHPYNFVSLPADGLGRAAEESLFQRRGFVSHNRYNPQLHSGRIDCTLTTYTHWFIPHADKSVMVPDAKGHKTLGYFTLDGVSDWNHHDPAKDLTRPAIPASSLRGMVRSVFEAATLSCLSVFDPNRLDFRIGRGLEREAAPSERGAWYLPARLSRDEKGDSWHVQLLDGREPWERTNRDWSKTLHVALIHAYYPRVLGGDRIGVETDLWRGLGDLSDGSEVAALLPTRPKRHHSGRFFYREASHVVSARSMDELQLHIKALEHGIRQPDTMLVFGFLHRTGPNIENKHHERLFFRWDADYNGPNTKGSITERYERFRIDTSPSLQVDPSVIEAARLGLQGYAERHGEDVSRGRAIPRRLREQPKPPYPSDFVKEYHTAVMLQAGDLCYALIEEDGGQSTVRGLYPVAMPRLSHDHSRGDLLHRDFHSCCNPYALCSACRVFGWVRELQSEEELKPNPDRVDAVAGHVRFTHAILRGEWATETQPPEAVPLAILGSPKPTTTEFYLQPHTDWEHARQQRWPTVLQNEQRPLYRQEEAVLRGRKFYRRRGMVNPQSDDPAQNGLRRPQNTRDSQNQTIHILPPGLEFGFRVYFDNLHDEELGALLFSLSLQPPDAWNQPELRLRHALGHGKSLGMGACTIRIDALQLDDLDLSSPGHRYAQVPSYTPLPPLSAAPQSFGMTAWHQFVNRFGDGWQRAEALEGELKTTRLELIELLRSDPPDGPMHYPPNPSGGYTENYRWFVQNRRRKGRDIQGRRGLNTTLPSPLDEREPQKRLPIDPTGP